MRMFHSRNEWFTHELQCHRREWVCQFCEHNAFSTAEMFSKHVVSMHPVILAGSKIEALILQSEEPVARIPVNACPLCDEWETRLRGSKQDSKRLLLNDGEIVEPYGAPKQFRRHLGRHMEQLALFALPVKESNELEDESLDELEEDDTDPGNQEDLLKPEPEDIGGVGSTLSLDDPMFDDESEDDSKADFEDRSWLESYTQQVNKISEANMTGSTREDQIPDVNYYKLEAYGIPVVDETKEDAEDAEDEHERAVKERVDSIKPAVEVHTSKAPNEFTAERYTEEDYRRLKEDINNLFLKATNERLQEQLNAETEMLKRGGANAKAITTENTDKKKPIRFKDAVGRKFSFPFDLCATWAVSFPLFVHR